MEQVPDDPDEARRLNRDRVARMRTGLYLPVDPRWREELPTRFATPTRYEGRGYDMPKERMLLRLRFQRLRFVAEGDDPVALAALTLTVREIRRLEGLRGIT